MYVVVLNGAARMVICRGKLFVCRYAPDASGCGERPWLDHKRISDARSRPPCHLEGIDDLEARLRESVSGKAFACARFVLRQFYRLRCRVTLSAEFREFCGEFCVAVV
ncbi:MAG: hypothetical protein HPM95_03920 [Alphaproteobacteria bacterium]|nr:hypothetical protein [Alphaproteobacteria bacterium]